MEQPPLEGWEMDHPPLEGLGDGSPSTGGLGDGSTSKGEHRKNQPPLETECWYTLCNRELAASIRGWWYEQPLTDWR